MSSLNNKFNNIFIHNPKVAGSWMEKKDFIQGAGHQSIYGYYKEGIDIEKYFKWMFVRNPYDRLVSSFHYSRRTIGGKNVSMRNHFWMLESFEKYILNLDELFDFSQKNFDVNLQEFINVHIVPQYYFACINDEVVLDFVGRFEELEVGWEYVCGKIGVNSNVEKSNQSLRKGHWIDFYTSELFEVVNEKYAKDFEIFDFPCYSVIK